MVPISIHQFPALENDVFQGVFYMASNDKIHPAVQDFLAYLEIERNASPGTIQGYRQDLEVFLRYLAGEMGVKPEDVDLEKVRRSHIRRFLAYLKKDRSNTSRTINRKLCALRSFYRFLKESDEWKLNADPAAGVASLKFSQKLPVYLTLDETEQLLASIKENSSYPERDYAIFLLFVQCGCRFSEVLNLTLDCIDLQEKTLRILGKGRKERIVPLTNRTVQALREYLRVRDPAVSTDVLFLNNTGRPLQASGLRFIFRRVVERSSLKKKNLTPHKLRHTCLTLLLQAGVDIRTLQQIAGHSNISTTQIYTHVSQEEVRRGMEKHPLG